jgi:hypothetical protein
MNRFALGRCVMAISVLSIAVAVSSIVTADPTCANICLLITDYYSDSNGKFFQWQEPDCTTCWGVGGLCVDPGPTQDLCSKDLNKVQGLADVDSADLVCPKSKNGYSQTTNSKGVGKHTPVGFRYKCTWSTAGD